TVWPSWSRETASSEPTRPHPTTIACMAHNATRPGWRAQLLASHRRRSAQPLSCGLVLPVIKRVFVGRPLATHEQEHQRIPKSIPAFNGAADQRVVIGLVLVVVITLANLRRVKESGRIFAVPTYIYIVILTILVVVGLVQTFFIHNIHSVPFDPAKAENVVAT